MLNKISILRPIACLFVMAVSSQLSAQAQVFDYDAERRDEIAMTRHRYELYQNARIAWIDSVCKLSVAQRNMLQDFNREFLAETVILFERNERERYLSILDHAVLQFANCENGLRRLHATTFEDRIRGLVTDEQLNLHQRAAEKRANSIQNGYASQILNMIDYELYLTSTQREMVCNSLVKADLFGQKMYSLSSYIMSTYRAAADQYDPIIQQLSPTQIERWNDLTRPDPTQPTGVSICTNQSPISDWDMQLYRAANSVAEKYGRAVKVRFDYIASHSRLDRKNSRILELSGRGIAHRDLLSWRKEMHDYYYKLAGSMYADSYVVMNVPQRPSAIEDHPIWKNISHRYNCDDALIARERDIKKAAKSFVVTVFDQELWLSESQRLQLETVFDRVFIDLEVPTRDPEYCEYPDVLLMARVLVHDSIDDLLPILNKEQKTIYRHLKSSFELRNNSILWTQRYAKNFKLGYIQDRFYLEELPKE
jgi:hypothetical protein